MDKQQWDDDAGSLREQKQHADQTLKNCEYQKGGMKILQTNGFLSQCSRQRTGRAKAEDFQNTGAAIR